MRAAVTRKIEFDALEGTKEFEVFVRDGHINRVPPYTPVQ
jgi:hypothetical protein